MMKKVFVACLLFLYACTFSSVIEFSPFTDRDAGYSVLFPNEVQRDERELSFRTVHKTSYINQKKSIELAVTYMDIFELENKSSQHLLQAFKSMTLTDTGMELLYLNNISTQEYLGAEIAFETKIKQTPMIFKQRLFLKGIRYYEVTAAYPKEKYNPYIDEFLESFTLI